MDTPLHICRVLGSARGCRGGTWWFQSLWLLLKQKEKSDGLKLSFAAPPALLGRMALRLSHTVALAPLPLLCFPDKAKNVPLRETFLRCYNSLTYAHGGAGGRGDEASCRHGV